MISRATTCGERYDEKGSNGGVWEWTSLVLDKVDGFVLSKLLMSWQVTNFSCVKADFA